METYAQFRPTGFDDRGMGLHDRQDWLVAPVARNRDSGCLDESNFAALLRACGGESDTVEVHRFGHWANGWFEIVIVAPDSDAAREAAECETALANYPILDESDFSQRETDEADRVWRDCYGTAERIAYIRNNRSQFEFSTLADMLGCVRGRFFAGYASELCD